MSESNPQIYFPDAKAQAVFDAEPHPQFLMDVTGFKVLVVGLEPDSQIPLHPAGAALYHFLEGEGLMSVGEDTFTIRPGVTVVVPAGVPRGMNARTRLIFLGSKGE